MVPNEGAALDGPDGPTDLFPHLKTALAPDWLGSDGATARGDEETEIADDKCDGKGETEGESGGLTRSTLGRSTDALAWLVLPRARELDVIGWGGITCTGVLLFVCNTGVSDATERERTTGVEALLLVSPRNAVA